MKVILRTVGLGIGLGIAISASSIEGRAQMSTILKRLNDHNNRLQTLDAEVTMVSHDATLNLTDTRLGRIKYLPKRMKGTMAFRLDWRSENGRKLDESISIIGDEVKLYQGAQKLLKVGTVKKSKEPTRINNAFAFLSMSRNEVEANYELAFLGEERVRTGEMTWHIQLTPKAKAEFTTIEIWIDKDGMPLQFKSNRVNKDHTGILLSDIKKNEKLVLSTLEVKPPKGTKTQNF